MAARFAIVALLPQSEDDPLRADFVSRELESMNDVAAILQELDERQPKWRVISFCHIEDLPLLMESPT